MITEQICTQIDASTTQCVTTASTTIQVWLPQNYELVLVYNFGVMFFLATFFGIIFYLKNR